MMNDRLEEQLRSSLDRQAEARPATGPDLGDVFGRARRIQRRRTAIVTGVAAAAVLAVVVPTAIALGSGDHNDHGLAPATSSPSVSATTPVSPPSYVPTTRADDPTAGLGIGGLSIGSHTDWTYLDPQQRLHGGGTMPNTLLKHGGARLIAFTPYHGGWIVAYDDNWIIQADSTGAVVKEGRGGTLVTSSDGLETAFQIGRTVYAGIASGMSDGEQRIHLTANESLLGFLGAGVALTDGTSVRIVSGNGGATAVTDALFPTTVSLAGDLIGGVMGTPARGDQEGGVADGTSGAVLWHSSWRPMAFSPDGKYVAAVPVVDNGDPSAYAILDARTGALIARTPAAIADKVYLGWQVVWDTDSRIVFDGYEAGGERRSALLALTTDGLFDQASEPMTPVTTDQGQIGFVLMTQ